jgi:hypothetical protein
VAAGARLDYTGFMTFLVDFLACFLVFGICVAPGGEFGRA